MGLIDQTNLKVQSDTVVDEQSTIVLDANQLPNAVLKRLMEEVKNDQASNMFAYDRAHNRHNRS